MPVTEIAQDSLHTVVFHVNSGEQHKKLWARRHSMNFRYSLDVHLEESVPHRMTYANQDSCWRQIRTWNPLRNEIMANTPGLSEVVVGADSN